MEVHCHNLQYKTDVKINSLRINQNEISLIINTSDGKKAHGLDNISAKVIQIWGDTIALLLI